MFLFAAEKLPTHSLLERGVHTDRLRRLQKELVTTNQIYRCEEFEQDNVSVYDEIEENMYDDLQEHAIYLDVVADDGEASDQGDKPELPRPRENIYLDVLSDDRSMQGSRPPSPRPSARSDHSSRPATPRLDTTSHNQCSDYEGLKKEEHDHTYTGMNSESVERGGDSEDQTQEANTQHQSGDEDTAAQD